MNSNSLPAGVSWEPEPVTLRAACSLCGHVRERRYLTVGGPTGPICKHRTSCVKRMQKRARR